MYREEIPYTEIDAPTTRDERHGYWEAACGLQQVDGLEVSEYARSLGHAYVEGEISAHELASSVHSTYEGQAHPDSRTREGDLVASRIPGLLESQSFDLSPRQLYVIHGTLFAGVFPPSWVGRQRVTNLSKPEPVLGGRSVVYADQAQISAQLAYDFGQERATERLGPIDEASLAGIARFAANVWQTHPFREGNTRATAVFLELYLRSLGCPVDNEPFERHSTYFRDALVRASYSSIQEDVHEDPGFLERFLENVALGASHDLSRDDLNAHGIRADASTGYRRPGSHR